MREVKIINNNKIVINFKKNGRKISSKEVTDSWQNGFIEKINRNGNNGGLRKPQYGALSAIRAHWTISSKPATIVLPTGTGKTETMLATILSEQIESVLIIVPSNLLRDQTFEKAKSFGILPDLKMVGKNILYPNTVLYKTRIKDETEVWEWFSEANVIVSTVNAVNGLSTSILNKLVEKVDVLMIDEAHHIAAGGWSSLREKFLNKRILQFTATPFRADGKKIDGDIIYNYSLSLAQKDGYFKPIDFYPIEEFNEELGDIQIAEKAVELLNKDLEDKYMHQLLVRANSKKRAEELYNKIYSIYKKFNPVLIISGQSKKNKENLKKLREGIAKIVVCVDMFGEGIDIPNLKIAAIHDKYKSLPITLQFIGRFARSKSGIGNARIVTNIANDDLKDALQSLYSQDADWNQLLSMHSSDAIQTEISHRKFINQFYSNDNINIDISQIKMRISTRVFYLGGVHWNRKGWRSVLNVDKTEFFINEESSVMILIESIESQVDWSDQKDISKYNYDVFIIYVDKKNKLIFINETNASKGNQLIKYMFSEANQISGERVFRVLDGINQLMIGTLGLKEQPSGRISFRMFAGTNIKDGINQVARASTTKSNLFATGYKDNNKISIGCSYKGKVWMRWVDSVVFWRKWCQKIGSQILDSSINTDYILENSLQSEEITEYPRGIPYKIQMPVEFELSNSELKAFYIPNEDKEIPFYLCEFNNPRLDGKQLLFELWINERKYTFSQTLKERGFVINRILGKDIKIKKSRNMITVEEYLQDNLPQVTFFNEDGSLSIVEGNLVVNKKPLAEVLFPKEKLHIVDWKKLKVDITIESQGLTKLNNSIQYASIKNIVPVDSLIIFDDDNSGEIADIVCISTNEEHRKITVQLYHCKYSHGTNPGARLLDLYEVCGQAERSITWNDSMVELLKRMRFRENKRINENKTSRFEKGNLSDLKTIENQIRSGFETEMKISIVQPGVSISNISQQMNQLLLATDTYLKETYGIDLNCYFSK
ncbi:type III restriction endonuclease subunit R [Bacillus subtilis]|uniref:DEAD/DEAH box helicase n=1 Tax=Bacillus TaxID=1386 RepID=UPI00061DC029|nr:MULTISPECIES: DEAD/DEAH box helicase family protein [Bacillus]AKE22505.1 hypothetical protein BsLM_0706 [Bacillus sp. LM 4-2]ASV03550.1 type III restriction endonuclease subunit R [Bacillus subtilis]AYK69626.1 DEAD/DEAH box helicase [Bacillus subtilis subsp. subtilis]AYK73327.1 DEAD/DEAH box helicase [Bacillus subtilis subsp. subtilis]AYL00286.1 DEAD/DEAH box helicase [Bacillus subtilis subsp. subtilis]